MKSRSLLAAAAALTAATALASAGTARANTYCVAKSPCSGTVEPDLQTALGLTSLTTVPDRIELGAGTFTTATGFSYTGGGKDNSLELIGAGVGQAKIVGTSSVDAGSLLRVAGGAPSKVSDLALESTAPPDPTCRWSSTTTR